MSENSTHNPRVAMTVLSVFFLLCIVTGTVFYHLVEGLSLVDAFYLTSMTLTTVGYGDFAPQTDAGKLFTSFFSFIGVGTFLGFASIIFRQSAKRAHRWPFVGKS
jgi:voltage-gated potassium channel Kch